MSPLSALDAIHDPIFLVRPDGSIRHRNRAANEAFPSSSLLGERLSPVSPGARAFAQYLSSCAGSNRPFLRAIDLIRGNSVSRYRCRGSLMREGTSGASHILLHLLPGRDLRVRPNQSRARTRLPTPLRTAVQDPGEIRSRVDRERDRALLQLYRTHHDERRSLARDLHDQVGQHIVGLKLNARAISEHLPGDEGRQRLEQLERQLDAMALDLHDVALRLRPAALDDFGLGVAIRHLLDEWGAASGLQTEIAVTGTNPHLPSILELTLYYACKEALTNAVKHATGATHLGVTLHYGPSAVTLTVEDDGAGFPHPAYDGETPHRPLGLMGLRERLDLVGGELSVESSPGEGSTVIARVPREWGAA